MLQDLGLKSTGATSIVKRYLYPTKLYKQQYEFIMLRNIKILLVFEKNLNFFKRLNQTSILAERTGVFYGQCSEICGVWHGFMPIAVEAVSVQDYLSCVDAA